MIQVRNRKAIRMLAVESFKANRSRNTMAVIAILLTAVLFTTLFTMGIGTVESLQRVTMRQAGGDGHAVLKYITDEEFRKVKDHPLIREIAYNRILSDDVVNPELLKRRTEFWYFDDIGQKLGMIRLKQGHRPQAANEVMADTKTLELLGVPLEAGAPLKLSIEIRGQTVQRDFVLSGWWESDPVFNIGQILASRAYLDAHHEELQNTYKKDSSLTGAINAYILFRNSLQLEDKLAKVMTESGFSTDPDAPDYINHNVNWAYLSTSFGWDAGTLTALGSGLLLVGLTGYLIIYNIFQISVIRDIRFYGLLKTIGTTGKQIRRIIRKQALWLSGIGIPIGLFTGYVTGKALVPLLIRNTTYGESEATVSPNPWIFLGAGLFALVTVLISTYKPGRMAAAVPPVEAVRYTDGGGTLKGKHPHPSSPKRSVRGGKLIHMARANLGRNKKRTVLVITSLSLSLVLLNTVFTLSRSMDMDKYLSKFVDTDFLIAHADYFQYRFRGTENQTTESFIRAVEAQPGFEEGGRLYGGREEGFTVEDKTNIAQTYNKNQYGDFHAVVYGLEDVPLRRLELIDGELDFGKLATGRYILEGVSLDDHDRPEMDNSHFAVGDTVTLHQVKEEPSGQTYATSTFQVLGHVAVKYYTNSDRISGDYTFYLPADVYKILAANPAVMSYAFNVTNQQEEAMEQFLKSYTGSMEPTMHYTSKRTSLDDLSGLRRTVVMIGGTLSLIMGLIGILNFINAILTGILTRQQEFAMLQSIGMTRRQLIHMLMAEGLYYSVGTCAASLLLGTLFSFIAVRPLCSLLWFTTYHFILWPLLIIVPVLLLLGAAIPLAAYLRTENRSIVERLREAE